MSFDNTHGCETITTNKKQQFLYLKNFCHASTVYVNVQYIYTYAFDPQTELHILRGRSLLPEIETEIKIDLLYVNQ